jgi:hypothetical protein
MRTQGIEAKRALEILRPQIRQLSQDQQVEIVRQVRRMETQSNEARRPDTRKVKDSKPTIKPISQKVHQRTDTQHKGNLARTLPVTDAAAEYEALFAPVNTRKLGDEGSDRDTFFGSESMLVLSVRGSNISFKVRPQKHASPMVVGRSDQYTAPDIDLAEFGAAGLGVSRNHMSITYDSRSATLAVTDMNTVNGTFINGVKLLPQEVRVLRHGDELRLGQLVMTAHFYFAEG